MPRNAIQMKKTVFLFLLAPLFTYAQEKVLLAEGVSPNLFLSHKVEPKENYYSIGRIYNVSPKDIAPFNKLQLEAGLHLGQQLKIPLNSSNFFQSGNAEATETFVPVYYLVKEKEGLYRVAKNHNDLPLETLKQWNNIKGESVKNGTRLIVGYLKVKTGLSPLAKKGIGNVIDAGSAALVKSPEKDRGKKNTEAAPAVMMPEKRPAVNNTVTEKQEPAKPIKETAGETSKKTNARSADSRENNFKVLYDNQNRNAGSVTDEGIAGVFKSTSGWSDKKYYCLHNQAAPGTIVKITNISNQHFIFAKVLDLMPDIKQNEALLILLSNAAAAELGAAEANFNCSVMYSK